MIFAIDFDNTIAYSSNHHRIISGLFDHVKTVIDELHDAGHYIIIWTCRRGKDLKNAIKYLDDNKIYYDKINENMPDEDIKTSNKVFADYYIDDKSFPPKDINWHEIDNQLSMLGLFTNKDTEVDSMIDRVVSGDDIKKVLK